MVKVQKNLVGEHFGKLTVIRQVEDYVTPQGVHCAKWECKCSCGSQRLVYATTFNLKHNKCPSCGCSRKQPKPKSRKYNRYNLSGEYGIGYTDKGEEFWFDLEDYDKIKDYYWSYDSHGYVITQERSGEKRKRILLHRLVMGNIPSNLVVDHRRHPPRTDHKIDNRKSNLQIKTNSQNMMNTHPYTTTRSGVLGVTYDKTSNKWQSRIGINGKRIHLGWFDNKDDTIKARKEAEVKYFGNYRFDVCNAQEVNKYGC